MKVTVTGVLKGKLVELEDVTGLPEGSRVQVTLDAGALSLERKRQLVGEVCGSWAGDDTLTGVFEAIEQRRQQVIPRHSDCDVAP